MRVISTASGMTEIKDVVQLAAETSRMPDSLQLEISVSFFLFHLLIFSFHFSFHLLCVFIRFFNAFLLCIRQESCYDAKQWQEGTHLEDKLDARLVC